MQDEQCWVIKKGEYYVNANFGALFSGVTTGFIFYSSEDLAKEKLNKLDELDNRYYIEYMNLKDIPNGERVHVEVDIENARFWICGELPIELQGLKNCLTPGRAYGLLYNCNEYYFYDNLGNNVNYFLIVPGKFVQ